MTKTVYVTPAQKAAAKAAVRRSEITGKKLPSSVGKIASAKTPSESRSASARGHTTT